MDAKVLGIHHITAIAGDPQQNVDFYAGILGLRLIKKTVNFDDPFTYHFYFGNETGSPGTIITFFPWSSRAYKGRIGHGQVIVTAFSVPQNAISFWIERFQKYGIEHQIPFKRFDEEVLSFRDADGINLELVASGNDSRLPTDNHTIPPENAITGFYNATLSVKGHVQTAGMLTQSLDFRKVKEAGNRFRYEIGAGGAGNMVDVICTPDNLPGTMGVGVVHHIAWRIADETQQLAIRTNLVVNGCGVTPVIDRNYFRSIYFREPGNILFEIATDPPGFTIDENVGELGKNLMLPPWLESKRLEIEQNLPSVKIPDHK